MQIPLNHKTITVRLKDLAESINELEVLAKLSEEDLIKDHHNFALASFYLLRSLEDILSIGAHVLSRLFKVTISEKYNDILPELARPGIIPQEFANRNTKLGSYRNRLVHDYLKITPEEMFNILQTHLVDLKLFGQIINDLINNPSKFNLKIE